MCFVHHPEWTFKTEWECDLEGAAECLGLKAMWTGSMRRFGAWRGRPSRRQVKTPRPRPNWRRWGWPPMHSASSSSTACIGRGRRRRFLYYSQASPCCWRNQAEIVASERDMNQFCNCPGLMDKCD